MAEWTSYLIPNLMASALWDIDLIGRAGCDLFLCVVSDSPALTSCSVYTIRSSFINTTRVVLVILSAAGLYATRYLILNDGITDYYGPQLLPGAKEPARNFYTGGSGD